MLIELGNPNAKGAVLDDRPKLTTVHIPDGDAQGLGDYPHQIGLDVNDFRAALGESMLQPGSRRGITRIPGGEAVLAVLHPDGLWGFHSDDKPSWVNVSDHELTPFGRSADVQRFLSEYWGVPSGREFFGASDDLEYQVHKELGYWTKTPPGVLLPGLELPKQEMLYVDAGRVISNINDGGGQVGFTAAATSTGSGSLTDSGAAWTTNQWAGYRVYAQSSTSNMVWANILSNNGTVLTVDRWYSAATPGGAAGSTPSGTSPFMIADGGSVSTWFVGLATGANSPVHGDTSLSTNGNAEITTASGGLIRKIAPYAQTSGVASRSFTLTPVYTANGSDSLPVTVTTIGVFCSMVVASTPLCMKFETTLNASATLSNSGDQLTATETVTGS